MIIQFTGLSGSGKSTLANQLCKALKHCGFHVELIDGDEYRELISKGLGFSKEDRITNIKRLGFIAGKLSKNKVVTIMAAIAPYKESRDFVKDCSGGEYCLIYTKCSMEALRYRDPKGLYHRAFLPPDDLDHIPNFTGVTDPYDEPLDAHLVIDTDQINEKQSLGLVVSKVLSRMGTSLKEYLD